MAIKTVTKEEKTELLNLNQDTLTVSLISKLFGKTTSKKDGKFVVKEPKFNVRDKLYLEAKEYINLEAIETTVGSFLFNKLMIEGMLENVIPNGYYNEVINKKGFNKLIKIISDGLMSGKISVNPTLIKWLKQYEFYGMKVCTIFSPSYSEGLLRKNAEINKIKNKLLKDSDRSNTQKMTEIEDELVAKSHDILKDDTGLTLFDSGARGSFDNDYKNMNLMLGPVAIPGSDGEFDFVDTNYIEGLQKKDIVAAGNVCVNSAYPKAVGTQQSGYLTKQYYAAYQSIQCDDDGTDCGTNLGIPIVLTKDNIEDYLFQNIITKNGYETLTSENSEKWLNKKVIIRSPMFCKNNKICSVCAGRRFYIMHIKNIGLTTGRITNTLLNKGMKNFHVAKVVFDEVDIDSLLL